jgi:hypothetical protein
LAGEAQRKRWQPAAQYLRQLEPLMRLGKEDDMVAIAAIALAVFWLSPAFREWAKEVDN